MRFAKLALLASFIGAIALASDASACHRCRRQQNCCETVVVLKPCGCSTQCTCGCNDGQECTCSCNKNRSHATAKSSAGNRKWWPWDNSFVIPDEPTPVDPQPAPDVTPEPLPEPAPDQPPAP